MPSTAGRNVAVEAARRTPVAGPALAVSRRELLVMAGFFPVLPLLSRHVHAGESGKEGLVVRNGWILRAEDLQRLSLV